MIWTRRPLAKVSAALARLAAENLCNVKGVGGGVFERVIDFGPGYRVYFGKDGDTIVVLLGGGTKKAAAAGYRARPRAVGRL